MASVVLEDSDAIADLSRLGEAFTVVAIGAAAVLQHAPLASITPVTLLTLVEDVPQTYAGPLAFCKVTGDGSVWITAAK